MSRFHFTPSMVAFIQENWEDLEALDSLPLREGHTINLYAGRHGFDLYDSLNWEEPNWNRSTQRSWKKQRTTQYKV